MLDTLSIDLLLSTLVSCCYPPSLENLSEGKWLDIVILDENLLNVLGLPTCLTP